MLHSVALSGGSDCDSQASMAASSIPTARFGTVARFIEAKAKVQSIAKENCLH
jgi:hypothetical protein